MVKIELLVKEQKVSKIKETELQRYIDFYKSSYKDNLDHSESNIDKFPRWSIISGYYAMHDISKLLIAKLFDLKIDREVHATTVKVLHELVKDKEILNLMDEGYDRFLSLADDLNDAKKERVKVQYYTGSSFMKDKYKVLAKDFFENVVQPYIKNILELLK